MTTQTVNPGVTSWIVVRIACRECGKPQRTGIEKELGARVRVTFSCDNRKCGQTQRQEV